MPKPIRNILCYSQQSFDKIMKSNGWFSNPPKGISCISICSDCSQDKHWFDKDYKNDNHNVFNLDIDDVSPFWFGRHESNCYDDSLCQFINGNVKKSNAYFSFPYIHGKDDQLYDIFHCLDYEEAKELVQWIERRIKKDDTIYVHCAAGVSRSQGVVRYIIDEYSDIYDIRLNPENPNDTYNPHVTRMLKRISRIYL